MILGASGVGKSTLLRLMAGLHRPDYGDIWIGEQEISRLPERQLRKVRRRIGMMFQGGALLDSMTVFDNVALALREHTKLGETEIADRVHAQFDAVGLKRVDALLPGELSGGMKKRAALARAMITEPEILLIDEPFSGLDPLAVRLIEALLREVNHDKGLTMILTNHHIGSTMRLADEIVFLSDGAAITGTVKEIKESVDPRIQRFLHRGGHRSRARGGELMFELVRDVGWRTVDNVHGLGGITVFGSRLVYETLVPPYRLRRVVDELYNCGVLSLAIICASGTAVGLVLALQGYNTLVRFGAEQSVGAVVGLSLMRELGPVLTALLVTGPRGLGGRRRDRRDGRDRAARRAAHDVGRPGRLRHPAQGAGARALDAAALGAVHRVGAVRRLPRRRRPARASTPAPTSRASRTTSTSATTCSAAC